MLIICCTNYYGKEHVEGGPKKEVRKKRKKELASLGFDPRTSGL